MIAGTVERRMPCMGIDVQVLPRLPPGDYDMAFVGWRTLEYLGKAPKVALDFRIVQPGPCFKMELTRWYNAKALKGRAGRHGGIKLGASSDLYRDFCRWTGRDARKDRIGLHHLESLLFRGRVEDVCSDRQQRALSDGAIYSVIRALEVVQP